MPRMLLWQPSSCHLQQHMKACPPRSLRLQLPKALALIPRHCLELFLQCAAYGQPVLGLPTASVMQPGTSRTCL